MRATASISALGVVLGAQAAMACEPLPAHMVRDPRISVAPDCSFTEGEYGAVGPFSGGAAVDLGKGRIGQRLSSFHDSGLCGIETQQLLVMDCTTGADILFDGAPRDGDAANFGTDIRAIQRPKGPLALGPDVSLEQLAAVASRNGIEYKTGSIRARASATRRKNRFDPLCGCKLYYPDSPGATK